MTAVVLEFFTPYLAWDSFDSKKAPGDASDASHPGDASHAKWSFYLECFVNFCEHIPAATGVGYSVRNFFLKRGIVAQMCGYIIEQANAAGPVVPPPKKKQKTKKKDSKKKGGGKANVSSLAERPSVPLLLKALHGLVSKVLVARHAPLAEWAC